MTRKNDTALADAIRATIAATGWESADVILDTTAERTGLEPRDLRRVWNERFRVTEPN